MSDARRLTPPTREELAELGARFATLRAARSLLPANAVRDALGDGFAGLPARIESLEAKSRAAEAGALRPEASEGEVKDLRDAFASLDADLADAALRLCDAAAATSLDALRAAAARGSDRRGALLALVDLLVADAEQAASRAPLLAHLTSLLSIEERGSAWRVAVDPAVAAPQVVSLAAGDGPLDSAERELLDAARRCADGEAEPAAIDAEMRASKERLGLALLHAPVLRAAVYCDSVVWSRQSLPEGVAFPREPASTEPEPMPASAPRPADADWRDAQPAERGAAWPAASTPVWTPPVESSPQRAPSAAPRRVVETEADAADDTPKRRARWALTLVACSLAVWLSWGGVQNPENVRELPASELRALWPAIESGYRDGQGSGPLLIAKLGVEWPDVPVEERARAVDDLIERLESEGVRELFLYDASNRLAVYHAAGLPLHLAP